MSWGANQDRQTNSSGQRTVKLIQTKPPHVRLNFRMDTQQQAQEPAEKIQVARTKRPAVS
jgi:hypothetical protein